MANHIIQGMNEPDPGALFGRLLLAAGIILAAIGAILIFAPRVPHLGRLPGDIVWSRGSFRLYVPITTGLLISAALTLLFALLSLFRR